MTAKQKRLYTRILVALALCATAVAVDRILPLHTAVRALLFAAPYLVVGYDVLKKAWGDLLHGQAFDESLLMTIATVAAFAIGEYAEATAVMLLYQVGEMFQGLAVSRARDSVSELMRLAPDDAFLEGADGVVRVDPEKVAVGSVLIVRAGERIALDGVVLSGESWLDTSALTGESAPRYIAAGDEIYSGCVNGEGVLRVRTTKRYEDSAIARMLELVENAAEKKAQLEQFITRFARVYTPVVTVAAALLAVVPPLVLGVGFGAWLRRACVFLIVSCPCALVVSVPLAFFGGIGAASHIGVLVKGGNVLEALAACDTMVFDKTGTLTHGEFLVTRAIPAAGVSEGDLLCAAAYAESGAKHPVARAVRAAYGGTLDRRRLSEESEIASRGTRALWDGAELLAGNDTLMSQQGVAFTPCQESGTLVYVAHGGKYLGCLVVSDEVKDGAAEALQALRAAGVRKIVMLSGDREGTAQAAAADLEIDEVHAGLLPADKVSYLEELLAANSRTAFVGDGVNDAPSLMRADVGVAMGALGSDAAIEAADMVLMDDDLRKLAVTMRIGRKAVRIARENTILALTVKLAVLVLGALGRSPMWLAVFADVGVTLLAVFNAIRTLAPVRKAY